MNKSVLIQIIHAIGASACLFVIYQYSKIDSIQVAAINAVAGIGLLGNLMCMLDHNMFRKIQKSKSEYINFDVYELARKSGSDADLQFVQKVLGKTAKGRINSTSK
jgi:hypothetical protein